MMENTLPSAINILDRVMSAAGWHSNHNRLFEAVPHMSDTLSADDMIKTLENLGVPIASQRCSSSQIQSKDCPALFIQDDGAVVAMFERAGDNVLACDIEEETPDWRELGNASGLLVRLERFDSNQEVDETVGFSQITREFSGLFPWLVFASFMSNLAGLATPLLIMVIYDRVIPSGSVDLVFSLVLAVLLALAADCGFRYASDRAPSPSWGGAPSTGWDWHFSANFLPCRSTRSRNPMSNSNCPVSGSSKACGMSSAARR